MDDIIFYLNEGWQHIISPDALDHQLFIIAMGAIFLWKDRRKVLILVTAFTLGHSLTLALSIFDVIRFDTKWVEFLIPCTILFTSLNNLRYIRSEYLYLNNINYNYFMALSFGLIHGMGFANSIRMMLAGDQSIAIPLLSFNIGLELGQIAVIAALLLISQLLIVQFKIKRSYWIIFLSALTLIFSVKMILGRMP
jgi:hypothetical protein